MPETMQARKKECRKCKRVNDSGNRSFATLFIAKEKRRNKASRLRVTFYSEVES